jgi:dTDP-4-amino-4,6-dideoxygalactose transaminase
MINLFQPQVDQNSIKLLEEVFESKWLGRGAYVANFEKKLADFLKISNNQIYTIANCSDAIFGAFEVLGVESGSEVIVPSISFPAVGSAIVAAGLIPKIIDIDCATGNINFDRLANELSTKTAAVFITHYGGIPVDVPRLRKIIGEDIYIIEDAACALGTKVNGIACGTLGDFGCWSFDAMKLLTCGEGGAMYVADSKKMSHAKEYFYLGLPAQAKSGIDRQENDSRWWEYQLNCEGRRSVFTNVNAAIGLPQFDSIENALSRRKNIRTEYCKILDSVGCDYLRQDDELVEYSNYFFTVKTKRRDELAGFLKKEAIYSSFRYYPLHKIDLFTQYAGSCKEAEKFSEEALNIPIHQALTDDEVMHISNMLQKFFK